MQLGLFDEPLPAHCLPLHPKPKSGEQLAREGIARAAAAKQPAVAIARELAVDVSRGILPHADGAKRADGLCNADDIAFNWPAGVEWLGNAAGATFTDGNWQDCGYVKSTRPHAHGNPIKQWRRKHGD